MIKILVISGKAGSGKSFLAEHLKGMYEEMYGYRVANLAYGDPLKMIARNLYGWNGKKGESGRKLLQRLGTDIVHPNNKFCWAGCIANIILGLRSEFDLFIIPDARFRHEIGFLEGFFDADADIITIRVDGKTSLSGESANHASETELDNYPFDYYFPNQSHNLHIFFYNLVKLIYCLEGDLL